jgi:hypothetical protein
MFEILPQFLVLGVFLIGCIVCLAGGVWCMSWVFDAVLQFRIQLPRRGAVGKCSLGRVGVIEVDEPVPIQYQDGNRAIAWTGRCIWPPEHFGQVWSSRSPKILGYAE